MKVITIQDGNKFRVLLTPESPVDDYMLQALRCAEGSTTKVIPVETSEVEKVINPYRDRTNGKDVSKAAVMIEMEVTNFPNLVPAEPAAK